MRSMLFFCLFFSVFGVTAQQANCDKTQCSFYPWVDIFTSKDSQGIKITADHNDFTIQYNPDEKRFFPLRIFFDVESTSDPQTKISYQLTQGIVQHACKKDSESEFQLVDGVTFLLDDEPFPFEKPEEHKVENVKTQKHKLDITFPEIPQENDEEQTCLGRIGIIASLVDTL